MTEAAAGAEAPHVVPIPVPESPPVEAAEAFEETPEPAHVAEESVAQPAAVEAPLAPIPAAVTVEFPDFKDTKGYAKVLSNLQAAFEQSKTDSRETYNGKILPGGIPALVAVVAALFGLAADLPGGAFIIAGLGTGLVEFFSALAREEKAFNMVDGFTGRAEEIAKEYTLAFNAAYEKWQTDKHAKEVEAAKPLVAAIDARVRAGHTLNSEHMRKILEVPFDALEGVSPALQITTLQIRQALYNVKTGGDFPIPTYKSLKLDPKDPVHEGVLLTALEAEDKPLGLGDKLTFKTILPLKVKSELYDVPKTDQERSNFILNNGKDQYNRALDSKIIGPNIPDDSYPMPDNLVDTIEAYEVSHPQLDLPVLARG